MSAENYDLCVERDRIMDYYELVSSEFVRYMVSNRINLKEEEKNETELYQKDRELTVLRKKIIMIENRNEAEELIKEIHQLRNWMNEYRK